MRRLIGVLIVATLLPASASASLTTVTRRIRQLDGWATGNAGSARQTTTWFLNRPARGCLARMTGSGRQLIEFREPEGQLTLLHFRSDGLVTPATLVVQARVRRYGTVTLHESELPGACTGERGRPKGDVTMGTPDPEWSGGERVAPGGPFGSTGICGQQTGQMDLHFALRGTRLHMSGELHDVGDPPFAACPFFGFGLPPVDESQYRLLPIDLPLEGDVFDRRHEWLGVNRRADRARGSTHIIMPLVRRYPGNPHGATVLDAAMVLQLWPPGAAR